MALFGSGSLNVIMRSLLAVKNKKVRALQLSILSGHFCYLERE